MRALLQKTQKRKYPANDPVVPGALRGRPFAMKENPLQIAH